MSFINVILPIPIQGSFTYALPDTIREEDVRVGSRVIVPFGSRHLYTGIVESKNVLTPNGLNPKEIISVIDSEPIIRHPQLKLWNWISTYYLCSLGEVFKAAVPAGLKIESETVIELNPDFQPDYMANLDSIQMDILNFLGKNGKQRTDKLTSHFKNTTHSSIESAISSLIDKNIIIVSEKLRERYRATKKTFVRLTISRGDSTVLSAAFDAVKRAPKQISALTSLIGLTGFNNHPSINLKEVSIDEVMDKADVNHSHIKELCSKGLCQMYEKEISRFSYDPITKEALPTLTHPQEKALQQIHKSLLEKQVALLHGVTSSGKTEIYLHLIDYVLNQGKQALFLVPEIALTTQLTKRLQKVFGEKVIIYHSKFSDSERVDIWRRLLNTNEPVVVIGARSAVFLPFAKLGIVIVDEEHEPSYKQMDPAPRYNGRDVATVLATMHGAKTVFGSATPSIETYYKAKTGKFGLVELSERYAGAELPEMEIIDMAEERRNGRLHLQYFSQRLVNAIDDSVVNNGKQAILFHNRRGFAPMARCRMCQFVPKCDFCDVSLTYHRKENVLSCHYCGAKYPLPRVCPNCGEPAIEILGLGTERLEQEISDVFHDKRVLRMDLDTTRNKDAYSKIIDEFSSGESDILVGTQMVTKGLDFENVQTVGVLNADSLINFPDFRSTERAFNMLVQVGGRSGRNKENNRGKVIIQAFNPDKPAIKFAAEHDYIGFYNHEIEERRCFNFPPFCRLINIYFKHKKEETVEKFSRAFHSELLNIFGQRVSSVQKPYVSRVQTLYIRNIMLKIEIEASMSKVKDILRETFVSITAASENKGVNVYYDVDPV